MGEPIQECPYCKEMVKAKAIKCPRCYTVLDRVAYIRESFGGTGAWLANRLDWSRRQQNKLFLGVCSSLAQRTSIPVAMLRVLFVFLALTGGHGVLVYTLLFLLLPEPRVQTPGGQSRKVNENEDLFVPPSDDSHQGQGPEQFS